MDPGSPFSHENGDPDHYFHNTLGTPRSPFSQEIWDPHENGDPQCWICTLTGPFSLAMTNHLLQHYSLLLMQAFRLRLHVCMNNSSTPYCNPSFILVKFVTDGAQHDLRLAKG